MDKNDPRSNKIHTQHKDEYCAEEKGKVGRAQRKEYKCRKGSMGKYVMIRLNGKNYLTLCEVEVYGGETQIRLDKIRLDEIGLD